MARAFVLVLVAVLSQPLRAAAQAPAAELYSIVFAHGFVSAVDRLQQTTPPPTSAPGARNSFRSRWAAW